MRQKWSAFIAAFATAGLLACAVAAPAQSTQSTQSIQSTQSTGGGLERDFADPPDAARARTWWHWTGSNVTLEGITKDLEWMKRAGLAGLQLADVNAGGGQSVEQKIVFGTPEWFAAVRHAAAEADRLGLELTIFSSAGWSETGGPWVKPEQAMKKLVWSETSIEGPSRFRGALPPPPSNNGPFGNLRTGARPGATPDPTHYGDSAVIAYRTPPDEMNVAELKPKVTTSAGSLDGAPVWDGDLNTALTIPAPQGGGPAWVQFEFARPLTARAVSLAARTGIPSGRVLASDDGSDFRTLVSLPGAQLYRGGLVRTFAFPETTARFYRIEMTGAPLRPAEVMSQAQAQPAREYTLAEVLLHTGARVHRWEEKAGFSFLFEYESVPTPNAPAGSIISNAEVIDLTAKMRTDGTLEWEVPPGKWTVMRFGYSLTGAKNRPAVPAGLGYEVDKLSRKHLEEYLRGYTDPLARALGPLYGKSLRYVLLDSWEAGMQNWTEEMLVEFRRRRGYDPLPYLPALAGRVVGSAEVSDRFLWDFRRTLADMFAEQHYAAATEFLHKQGIDTYSEAAGVSLEIPEDTLLNKKYVDIPVGEFWMRDLHPPSMYYVDVRGAASSAHVYGKNIVAAESFTGGGYDSPFALKRTVDYWFAQGINRIIFHTSAHQPLDTKPGNTMVGTHVNRNITWAETARPFMDYLARNSYMLQKGLPVADLVYLLNEGAPSTMPFWGSGLKPAPPGGYDYDYINTDALLTRASVGADGRLLLPDGVSYRLLVLPEVERMTLPVLRKIRELVNGGAIVLGPKPSKSPSLAGYPEADRELSKLASDLWGDLDGVSRTRRAYGKGTVVWGQTPAEVLAWLRVPPDVEYGRELDADLVWLHRRDGEADIYFVANRADRARDVDVRFRVSGREAELWHADTGTSEPAGYSIRDGMTTVPLHLEERESLFVVFRRATNAQSRVETRTNLSSLTTLEGPWEVSFPPNLGAPPTLRLEALSSWTAQTDEGVKYFSGTAVYTKTLQAPRGWFRTGRSVLLDLGAVKDVAEVSLNGKALGVLWKPPFRVDVTGALKPGANRLEIKVTNQWTNRIIGDRAAPAEKRVLSANLPPVFGPPPVLADAGLLGPVTLLTADGR